MTVLRELYQPLNPRSISAAKLSINWMHPLAANLVAYYLPGQSPINLVTGRSATIVGTNFPVLTTGPYGLEMVFHAGASAAGGNDGFNMTEHPLTAAGGSTVSVSALAKIPVAGGATQGAPIYTERGTAGNDIIKLDWKAGPYEWTVRNDAGIVLQPGFGTFNDDKYHSVCGTKNANTVASNMILYIDGASVATASWVGVDSYTDATLKGGIGISDYQDSSGGFPGSIVYVAAWTRVLSPQEVLLISQDPFCLLVPDAAELPQLPFLLGYGLYMGAGL